MEWLAYGLVLFLGFYSSNRSSLGPNEKYFYGIGGHPEVCEELSPLEMVEKGIVPRGKLANYSNRGESVCYKNIFEPGDRIPEANLVAESVKFKISDAANNISKLSDLAHPIYIDTTAIKNHEIARYLFHSTVIAIANNHKVIKHKSNKTASHTLKIEMAPTAFKEDLLVFKLSNPIKKSEQISKWVIL